MRKLNPPSVLLAVAILAYGLLIPQLGFYWDDLPMSWIRYQLGVEALTRYFSNNRPVWGLLYQLTTHIFPQVPIYLQVLEHFGVCVVHRSAGRSGLAHGKIKQVFAFQVDYPLR